MKILFLAANPLDVVTQLRLDQEIREISRKIRMSPLGDQLELVSEWAIRPGDLQVALLRHKPDIVHFSGHCSLSSGIMLEDEAGNRKIVNRKALADLFSILKDNIRVVVLNACYAKDQAEALATTIDFTIGMNEVIEDKDAIIFTSHFYQSLAFGRSVREAFDLAVNQLEIEGSNVAHVPQLLERDGANASLSRNITEHTSPALRDASEQTMPGLPVKKLEVSRIWIHAKGARTFFIKRIWTIILVLLISSIASIVGVFHYNYFIEPSANLTPVDEWIVIGIERRHLEDALRLGIISEQEYMNRKNTIIGREDEIIKSFPKNVTGFRAYEQPKGDDNKRPSEFWVAILASIVTCIGTISAILLAWRNDRRQAAELKLKLTQLQQQIEQTNAPRIIIR